MLAAGLKYNTFTQWYQENGYIVYHKRGSHRSLIHKDVLVQLHDVFCRVTCGEITANLGLDMYNVLLKKHTVTVVAPHGNSKKDIGVGSVTQSLRKVIRDTLVRESNVILDQDTLCDHD